MGPRAAMLFCRALKRREILTEATKGTPLCMDTFTYVPDRGVPAFDLITPGWVDVRSTAPVAGNRQP